MKTMPFGKFKGVLIADLPSDYLHWLFGEVKLREPLRTLIAEEHCTRFSQHATAKRPRPEVLTMAKELVSAGYRKLSLQHHPDRNGDHKTMVLVNDAADFLRTRLRST